MWAGRGFGGQLLLVIPARELWLSCTHGMCWGAGAKLRAATNGGASGWVTSVIPSNPGSFHSPWIAASLGP